MPNLRVLKLPESATEKELGELVITRAKRSQEWLKTNYWTEWERTCRSYHCVRPPLKDKNGKIVKDSASFESETPNFSMPDTNSHVRRQVARVTSMPPHFGFVARDNAIAELISRTLCYQWDKGEVQSQQKLHVMQASIFGWSVRPWWWEVERYPRRRRIDPLRATPQDLQAISKAYELPPELLANPQTAMPAITMLLEKHGKGHLLPITYEYKAYEGPKTEFLFIGDCLPQPEFRTLNTSHWFIRRTRRRIEWMDKMATAYPKLKDGFQKLIDKKPDGDSKDVYGLWDADGRQLYQRVLAVLTRVSESDLSTNGTQEREWTIYEMHIPGVDSQIVYAGADEGDVIGSIEYPFDLDGRIAFTECSLIASLLSGIGDSTARFMQSLQELHDKHNIYRFMLIFNLLRPLLKTNDPDLIDNPALITRGDGFRLIALQASAYLEMLNEAPALSSAIASMNEEGSIQRLIQLLTGDSNMSMAANVDPQQNATATGARLLQANLDILTKDMIDALTYSSIRQDGQIMYLLNRSEMSDAMEFDQSPYDRNYGIERDLTKENWVQVTPQMFQVDGEITVKAGSILAEDDETKKAESLTLLQIAAQSGGKINIDTALQEVLIAHGKGRELQRWMAPPPPPPPPEPAKASFSVAAKFEMLPEQMQQAVLEKAGIPYEIQSQTGPNPPTSPVLPAPPIAPPQ